MKECLNTDWYDYGARFYDPQIGRFTTLDPFTELLYLISPYNYCFNNPITITDPSGMFPEYGTNYIASSYVDPSGKIIKVIDDDDINIYLVPDPANWNGSKEGLAVIGQTPEPGTLKNYVGKNINTEEVNNFLYNEAECVNKPVYLNYSALAHLDVLADILKRKEIYKSVKEELEYLKTHGCNDINRIVKLKKEIEQLSQEQREDLIKFLEKTGEVTFEVAKGTTEILIHLVFPGPFLGPVNTNKALYPVDINRQFQEN
jgi:RHS repeat-associated protein